MAFKRHWQDTPLSPKKKSRYEIGLLLIVILLTSLIVFREYLFAGKLFVFTDSEDDTFQSYLAVYQLMVNKFATGNFSFYSTALGMGSNILSAQAIAFDPFSLLLYIVGLLFGIEYIASALVYVQIARLLCAGLACRYFLKAFSLSAPARIIASWAYTFSSFAIGIMGQHYMFATMPVVLASMLACLERYRDNRKYLLPFTLLTAITGFWSPYIFYILLLGCGIYALLRYFQCTDALSLRSVASYFLPLLSSVICGAMLAGVSMLPSSLVMTTSSTRLDSTVSLWTRLLNNLSFLTPRETKTLILRSFSNQMQGTPWAWEGVPGHFLAPGYLCVALVPIAISQYLWALIKQPKNRFKVVTLIFSALVVLGSTTRLVGFVFNGFVDYATRYTICLIPLLGFLIAWLVDRFHSNKPFNIPVGLLTAGVCTGLVLWGCAWSDFGARFSGITFIACLWLFTLVFSLSSTNRKTIRKIAALCGVFVVFANIAIEGTVSLTVNRYPVEKTAYLEHWIDPTTHSAIDSFNLRQAPFIRTERAFAGYSAQQAFTYACVGYYRGVSYYNSVYNGCYSDFLQYILQVPLFASDWNRRVSYGLGQIGTPMDSVTADLFGLKYIVNDLPTDSVDWELVAESDQKFVYSKRTLGTAGLLYSSWCSEEDFEALSPVEQQALPAHTTVLQGDAPDSVPQNSHVPIKSLDSLLDVNAAITDFGFSELELPPEGGMGLNLQPDDGIIFPMDTASINVSERQTWIQMDLVSNTEGTFEILFDTGNGFSPYHWTGRSTLLASAVTQSLLVKLPKDTQNIRFSFNNPALVSVSNLEFLSSDGIAYSNAHVYLENPGMAGTVTGTVTAERDSILLIPLCQENGFTAKLDGQEVPILTAQIAFLSIEVPAGTHTVEISYDTPGMLLGMILSLGGLLGGTILCLWVLKINPLRKVVQSDSNL